MSYLEIKSGVDGDYVSFVKKTSLMGENFLIKRHIGKNLPTISKEKYLMDNIESLTEMEFSFRKKFICAIMDQISYNEELPFSTERKSIKINNLMEAKACHEIVYFYGLFFRAERKFFAVRDFVHYITDEFFSERKLHFS